jgi:hypothetical protein
MRKLAVVMMQRVGLEPVGCNMRLRRPWQVANCTIKHIRQDSAAVLCIRTKTMSASLDSSAAQQPHDGPAAYSAANAYGNFEITVKHVQIVMPKDTNLRGRYYCQIKCGDQFFRTGSVDIGGLIQGQQVQPVGVGALAVTLPFDYTCTVHCSPAALQRVASSRLPQVRAQRPP